MSVTAHTSRTHVWLEGLGDWGWPGRAAPPEVLPPPWVPAAPARLGYATAGLGAAGDARPQTRLRPWRIFWTGLASAVLALCCALALHGSLPVSEILGSKAAPAPRSNAQSSAASAAATLPALVTVNRDSAGSSIAHVSFASSALDGRGAFLVYLPPGYSTSLEARYPVLYLLHGRDGHASAFLEVGIQRALDGLIASGAMPPVIAVMIQDRSSLQNWQNVGRRYSALYVVEVQELADRMLRTVPTRAGRAIAGSSMGGFGAMHVALANPDRFAVVESWLGFFDGLHGELQAAAPVIARLGLHAFLYGAEADPVALPEEDPNFAAELRAAGADAKGVIYPGGHSLGKVRQHLRAGLLFAGSSLLEAERREAIEQAHARWRG
ncbi:MAG TPA: alpha/beta hydrolase-fold protein [Solirubrobacteraceae bacterium]|nr:alpha/beta hydrolase-fold protein [Solirubrobacteraceae bacterium]